MTPGERLWCVTIFQHRHRHGLHKGVEIGALARVVAGKATRQWRILVKTGLVLAVHAARIRAINVLGGQTILDQVSHE